MVCTQCGAETVVANSRHQKRSNQVWRRRRCPSCQLILTTQEKVDYHLSWVVWDISDGSFVPFARDKLFLSLYSCLQHREKPRQDATELTETVINKIPTLMMEQTIGRNDIARVAAVVLNRFDKLASAQYLARH